MRDRLLAKSFSPETTDQVIEKLIAGNLLNDSRIVERELEVAAAKGYGREKIRFRLQTRNIDEVEIENSLSDFSAQEEARRALDSLVGKSYVSDLNKLGRQLAQRGFSEEAILVVLERYSGGESD